LAVKLGIRAVPTTMIFPVKSEPVVLSGLINTQEGLEKILIKILKLPMVAICNG